MVGGVEGGGRSRSRTGTKWQSLLRYGGSVITVATPGRRDRKGASKERRGWERDLERMRRVDVYG